MGYYAAAINNSPDQRSDALHDSIKFCLDTIMRRLTIISLCLTSFLLASCSWIHPYQPSVQQGNILTNTQLERVRVGMSKDQVEEVLGSPVLVNTFNDNYWPYVYTYQRNGGPIIKKQLDLYFSNDRLVRIEGNYRQ